ncbi:SDR family NAD(P)-dependent oxidoreductase [Paraburkholderia xenovorans]|uniref:SDR family NAD(P)-dependent oxidoreductase n=1 Tax=Paraburkholderia xenovorans TaxID=36873 RepID=UPI0015593618|nr:SDR family NAD(P)-dependent oxidoreductase [Paraburkholderia xenovorans]NPT34934.1 glucose 1-dehydrogenase [Paraburkholderia xenovorans]
MTIQNSASQTAAVRIAIVTGGATGIGAAIAQRLASDGFRVVIADINEDAAQNLAGSIEATGGRASFLRLDVSDASSIDIAFGALEREHGRCDVLVNNAGIAGVSSFLECPLDVWLRVLAVNVTGPMLCGQRAARLMTRNGWGRVINIASISGVRASAGRTAYGTSKAAVIGLTRQMAIELAEKQVTVNSIAPGPIETPLTRDHHSVETRETYNRTVPMRRYGEPSEIADTVAFLCSDGAAYITGQNLAVDGGFLAAGILDI